MWALKKIIFATPDSRSHVCKCPINKEVVHHIQSKREKFKSPSAYPSAHPSARLITYKMGGEAGHSQWHYYTIFLHEKHVGIAEVTRAHLHREREPLSNLMASRTVVSEMLPPKPLMSLLRCY